MQIFSYKNYSPELDESCFIAPGVKVIGRVEVKKNVSIWFNSVVRADVNKIFIGESTNIQDLCMLHVTAKNALMIGANISVGHSAILHGCTVGEGSLIGMGAKILDGAIINKNSLVAAGSVVTGGKEFPAGSLIMGVPAKLVRALTPKELKETSEHYRSYIEYSSSYKDSLSL